jgi:diketogulonate reductase-like aldo/keto reductase
MASNKTDPGRRRFLQLLSGIYAGTGLSMALGPAAVRATTGTDSHTDILRKAIPSSGEQIPVIGMGSWMTFDVYDDPIAREQRIEVLQAFFDQGGGLIDSSPMYGSSEQTIGYCLQKIRNKQNLFAATKVWTWFQQAGIRQMQRSQKLWGVERFDLMQIHNLLDWETHLETLKQWKEEGEGIG